MENTMKKIIIISLALCSSCSVYSQEFSQMVQEIQKLTLMNDSLQKKVINPLQESISFLKAANIAEVSKLKDQINTLEKDRGNLDKRIGDFEKDIAKLSKNTVKGERDSLLRHVGVLTANSVELNKLIQEKEMQIAKDRLIAEQWAKAEKDKNEILANIANMYKNKEFDELIKISTALSVQRDMQFVGSNMDLKLILCDLEVYFNAEELLTRKFDAVQIENAQMQLGQMKRQSASLDKLKEEIEDYKDFNDELKKTIEKLIKLDEEEATVGDRDTQKRKFNKIVSELANYMYNYYDYGNYPYLSDIVLEIIKRKRLNADEDVADLLRKL